MSCRCRIAGSGFFSTEDSTLAHGTGAETPGTAAGLCISVGSSGIRGYLVPSGSGRDYLGFLVIGLDRVCMYPIHHNTTRAHPVLISHSPAASGVFREEIQLRSK